MKSPYRPPEQYPDWVERQADEQRRETLQSDQERFAPTQRPKWICEQEQVMEFQPLTLDDVTFEIFAEPDQCPVDGYAMASGDDDYDKEVEDEIHRRLDDGDVWAWAVVEVRGTVPGTSLRASDYLGACNYRDVEDFIKGGYYEDMVDAVLTDFNKQLATIHTLLTRRRKAK